MRKRSLAVLSLRCFHSAIAPNMLDKNFSRQYFKKVFLFYPDIGFVQPCKLHVHGHTTYRNTRILPKYWNTREKYKNTSERHLLKKPILALIKKPLYLADDLEKPRGQRSSCKQRTDLQADLSIHWSHRTYCPKKCFPNFHFLSVLIFRFFKF